MLGHYLATWDGGAYAKAASEGVKEEKTTPHWLHAKALGMEYGKSKNFTYAFMYGAGNPKLGKMMGGKSAAIGKRGRLLLESKILGLGPLIEAAKSRGKKKGFLIGLDGRKVKVRSAHAALNTLLQSAGAVVMKRALVWLDALLQSASLVPGVDYEFVLNVHDEWQVECKDKDIAAQVGRGSKEAFKVAGEYYGLKCPIDGDYDIGKSWAETH